MKFKDLTKEDIQLFKDKYNSKASKETIQIELSDFFGKSTRTIRRWAHKLQLGVMKHNIINPTKIMVYDIETSRATAKVFWTGKQYVGYKQIIEEPSIITIAWKWLGQDDVHYLTWDKNHSDEKMVRAFVKEYNKANMVIGYNNDNFDNRWLNARAMKYDIEINTMVRSLDLYKQEKRLFRLLSYSMDYSSLYAKVERKQSNEGMLMWDMIEMGTKEEQKEYMQKMLDYNIGDIITTEELYLRLIPYLKHQIHVGVFEGGKKWSCPMTGSEDVTYWDYTVTPAGTIQRIMRGPKGNKYKITNKQYIDFLQHK